MTDVGPANRTGDRRRRPTSTNAKTTTTSARHVEFSDLPPPPAPARPSDSDKDEDEKFDVTGGLASLLDPTDGNASVSARSIASVDTECTEKAGNRRRNIPNRIGVRATVSAAQAKKNAELAKRIAGYEEQYHQQRAEKGKKRGRNRNQLNDRLNGGGGNSSGVGGQQAQPSSGFQARTALAAAQGRAAAAASQQSASGGGSVGSTASSTTGSDGSSPASASGDGAQPEAKVVAEVMAELEAELDAEEDEERHATAGVAATELRRSRSSGDPGSAGGGTGGGSGRRSRGNSDTTTPTTELRRYKSAGPEHLPSTSTAAVAGSHPKLARSSRRRSSHLRDKEGSASGSRRRSSRRSSSNISDDSGDEIGGTADHTDDTTVPDVADKDVEAAAALFQMGQMEMTNGNFEAAARCLEQALIMNQTALGMDHPIVGDIQHSLGLVQIEYGKYETACMTLWEAQRIRKLNTDLVGAADSLQEIGKVHRQGGRAELALDCYGECLRVRRAELGDDNLKVADAYCDLGNTEGDLGRNTDALQHFKNALTILKLNSMNESASGLDGGQMKHGDQICHLLQKMSKMELDFGDVDHALAHLQEFVETRRLIGRASDVAYVEALVNVGRISKDHDGDEGTAYDVVVEALEVFDANRLGEINYGSHAWLGQEARDLLKELGGSSGTSQKSIFKRFGVGFDSLSDERIG